MLYTMRNITGHAVNILPHGAIPSGGELVVYDERQKNRLLEAGFVCIGTKEFEIPSGLREPLTEHSTAAKKTVKTKSIKNKEAMQSFVYSLSQEE